MKKFTCLHVIIVAVMCCAAVMSSRAQDTLYLEPFTYANGTTIGPGSPAKWTRDISGGSFGTGDHFEVRNNKFQGNDVDGEVVWLSQWIDVETFNDVIISGSFEEQGADNGQDYIRAFYKLGANEPEITWFNPVNQEFGATTASLNIDGNNDSLQLIIRVNNNSSLEFHRFDNILVTGIPPCGTVAGSASISESSIPHNQTVTLTLAGHSGTVQWQQSTDNVNFSDVSGATTTPFTTASLAGPNTYYFRAKVTDLCPTFSDTVSVTVSAPPAICVTNTNNAGPGSLRQAIMDANGMIGQTVSFCLPGIPPHTITLSTPLPAITKDFTVIDGRTQPDNGFTGPGPKIIVNGNGITGNGITVADDNVSIYGMGVTGFNGNGIAASTGTVDFLLVESCMINNSTGHGIFCNNVDNATIRDNLIGTDAAGATAQGNQGDGIRLINGCTANVIEGNVISANGGAGMHLANDADDNVVKSNKLGTDGSGTADLGNAVHGIFIQGPTSRNNTIGGSGVNEGNVIAFNGLAGVTVDAQGGISTDMNRISRNSMFCNGGAGGIELVNNGNDGVAAPVIASVTAALVAGTAIPNATIEVFSGDTCANCEGAVFLESTTAGGLGSWSLPGAFSGRITATATDTEGNTSAFAACRSGLVADAGNDTLIAFGDTVQIGGNPTATGGVPPYTFAWSPADSLSASNVSNPFAFPSLPLTNYVVTVTDANANTAVDTVEIRVARPFCAQSEVLEQQIADGIITEEQIAGNNAAIQQFIEDSLEQLTGDSHGPSFVIPVVVHVIAHPSFPQSDISDNQIFSQIEALNRAFSNGNGSVNQFTHNAEITFCLAQNLPDLSTNWTTVNPQGTPGITRKTDARLSDHSSSTEQGLLASIGFPPDKYLNIWVVNNITSNIGGVVGYATFPGATNPILDGIVIQYDFFGDNRPNTFCPGGGCFPLSACYAEGDVMAHEAGHYLNLWHTFEKRARRDPSLPPNLSIPDDPCENFDCSIQGDQVCDTPPVHNPNDRLGEGANYTNCGCPAPLPPLVPNTCATDPDDPLNTGKNPYTAIGDVNDMIENYMDYSLDVCKNTFTRGQVNRMIATLSLPQMRQSLVTQENLVFTGVTCAAAGNPTALTPEFFIENTQVCTGNAVTMTAVSNAQGNTATNYTWDFAGGTAVPGGNSPGPHAVTFNTPGIFNISLSVTFGSGNPVTQTKRIFVSACSIVQPTQANWFFGDNAVVQFSAGAPPTVPVPTPSPMRANEGVASISDATGNLLFYTNGRQVFGANHLQMPGGTLNGNPNNTSAISASQGVVIVPDPNPAFLKRYYVFTISDIDGPIANGLSYSLVDLDPATNGNFPFGAITLLNNNPADNFQTTEHMIAMPDCDATGWWIIVHGGDNLPTNPNPVANINTQILAYHVTAAGVANTPVFSNANTVPFRANRTANNWIGEMDASSDGRRMAFSDSQTRQTHIFDFDRAAGTFTLLTTINDGGYGVSFSPGSEILYVVGNGNRIRQYDLRNLTVCNQDLPSFDVGGDFGIFNSLQIGPDGKIYGNSNNSGKLLVINFPDQLNLTNNNECGFNPNGVQLFCTQEWRGLPNMLDALPVMPADDFEFCGVTCGTIRFTNLGCGNNFVWNFGDGGTSNTQHPTHTFTAPPNTFNVSFSIDGRTPVVKTVDITPPPVPQITPAPVVCIDAPSGNVVHSTNMPGLLHVWSVSGSGAIVGNNNLPAVTVNWSPPGGQLMVTVTDPSNGCTAVDTVDITVSENPSVGIGEDFTICPQESIDLFALTSGGTPPFTYTWSEPLPPTAGPHNIAPLTTTTFSVTVTDANGCQDADTITVRVDDVNFSKRIDTEDDYQAVAETDDFGFILAGRTSVFGPVATDLDNILLTKMNCSGMIDWSNAYGDATTHEEAYSIQQTGDGGYIVAGLQTLTSPAGQQNAFVFRTDGLGNLVWPGGGFRIFDIANNNELFSSVIETGTGDFVMVGESRDNTGTSKIIIVKYDPNGAILASNTVALLGSNEGLKIFEAGNGDYLIMGINTTASDADILLMRTNAALTVLFTTQYSFSTNDRARSLVETANSDILITGEKLSATPPGPELLLMRTDASGNVIFANSYDNTSSTFRKNRGFTIRKTIDATEHFIIGGTGAENAGSALTSNTLLMKVDGSGNVVFSNIYKGEHNGNGDPMACQTRDNGFVTAGFSYITKTNTLGQISCNTETISYTVTALAPAVTSPAIATDPNFFTVFTGITVTQANPMFTDECCVGCKKGNGPDIVRENNDNTDTSGEAELSMNLYPNPHTGQFTVSFSAGIEEKFRLTVFDVFGKTVYDAEIHTTGGSNRHVIDISKYAGGVYFVKLSDSRRQVVGKAVYHR